MVDMDWMQADPSNHSKEERLEASCAAFSSPLERMKSFESHRYYQSIHFSLRLLLLTSFPAAYAELQAGSRPGVWVRMGEDKAEYPMI